MEEAREEEGTAEMVNEFPDLIGANGNEAFVTTEVTVFLFEDDARNAADFTFLGGDVFAGIFAGNGEDGFVVLWVRFWKAVEVG